MLIPEGALLFAMHPAIVDSALGKTSSEDSQNERATLAANEPLDVRSVRSLLVARPGAPSSFLLLVVRPLLLVAMPLLLVAMHLLLVTSGCENAMDIDVSPTLLPHREREPSGLWRKRARAGSLRHENHGHSRRLLPLRI